MFHSLGNSFELDGSTGQTRSLFVYFRPFHIEMTNVVYNLTINRKKHGLCAWDSNLGL